MTPKKTPKKRPPAKKPRPSTTGKVRGVKADQTTWRRKLQQSKIKFDDDQKAIYLAELAKNAIKSAAAKAAGVCIQTVGDHRANDDEFAQRESDAIDAYREKLLNHHQNLLFEGEITKKYDKDGNEIEVKHTYPIRLIELELKRHEPSYRDKQQIELSQTGGVLVAPDDMDPEEWIKKLEAENAKKTKPGGGKDADK